uniref:lipocalin-like domain-containing protein n=1 Tax=Jeotgalibaca porci TaxID=1868793 RepID=UPI00359F58D8
PVIAPRRYAGEKIETVSYGDVQGDYLIIEDQNAIVPDTIVSQGITITNKKISGDYSGKVELGEQGLATVQLNGETVNGHFLPQWDEYTEKQTMTFTGLTPEGKAFMMVRK